VPAPWARVNWTNFPQAPSIDAWRRGSRKVDGPEAEVGWRPDGEAARGEARVSRPASKQLRDQIAGKNGVSAAAVTMWVAQGRRAPVETCKRAPQAAGVIGMRVWQDRQD